MGDDMKNIIKNIKSVLKKEYYIREMVLLVVISLSLLCFGLYESLALFQTNIEKSSVATIIAGDINFALTSIIVVLDRLQLVQVKQ